MLVIFFLYAKYVAVMPIMGNAACAWAGLKEESW